MPCTACPSYLFKTDCMKANDLAVRPIKTNRSLEVLSQSDTECLIRHKKAYMAEMVYKPILVYRIKGGKWCLAGIKNWSQSVILESILLLGFLFFLAHYLIKNTIEFNNLWPLLLFMLGLKLVFITCSVLIAHRAVKNQL